MINTLINGLQFALTGTRGLARFLVVLALCLLVGGAAGAVVAFLSPMYTVALVIGLIGATLILRDMQWGFYAAIGVICLLPFAAVPLNMGFEPTFLDLVLVALFFVWASRIATRQQGPFVASPLAVPILAFLAIIMASFVAGLGHSSITTTLLRRFAELLLGIVTYFVVINGVRTPEQLKRILQVLILAGAAAAFIGIVLYFLPKEMTVRLLSTLRVVRYPAGAAVLRYVEDTPDLPLRATSTSQDPNVLGGLLILVTGVTVPQLFAWRPVWPKRLLLPLAGVMLLCLILTYSRSAMAGLAVGLAAVSVLRYRRMGVLLVVVALLFLVLPQAQGYIQRFSEGVQGQDLATQMRFGEYRDAFTLIMRHPWLGVGFAGVPEINLYLGVSSVYLLVAEETGLVGLGLFGLILVVLLVVVARARRALVRDSQLEAIYWGLAAALLGALFGGILDHYFFNLDFPHAVTLFWLYVGLLVAVSRLAQAAALPAALPAVGR